MKIVQSVESRNRVILKMETALFVTSYRILKKIQSKYSIGVFNLERFLVFGLISTIKMKKSIFIFFVLFSVKLFSQSPLLLSSAFTHGEKLSYRVHYGIIEAGTAEIEIMPSKKIGDREVYHAIGKGYSNSAFDLFFKVRDRYDTYIDKELHAPLLFLRRVDEGGYKISQNQIYNHKQNVVNSDGKMFEVPHRVQDMLSAFYYARNMDYSKAKEGEVFSIPTFVDNEIFPLKMRYVGKQIIKSDIGKVRCLVFRPIIQKGRVFKSEEDLAVYVTDDLNHIPVRAEAKILVGSIKMDLTQYQNIKNPIAFTEKRK